MNSAFGASFTISSDTTDSSGKTLNAGSTGTVNQGVSYTVTGGNVGVTVTGANVTISNQGTLSQSGTGRLIRDNTGVANLLINNGSSTNKNAIMQANDADVIQLNKAGGSVTLNNYGTMLSNNASSGGAQAVDFNAMTTGANTINNFSTGLMKAFNADAVRPGAFGVVNNDGTILSVISTADGSGSDGIDFQNNTAASNTPIPISGTVNNSATGLIEGGRHGITGGQNDAGTAFTLSVTNSGTIKGDNGSGINIDGLNSKELVTVTNNIGGVITGNGVTGDGDGVDVDAVVNLTNYGTIQSLNAFADTSEGLSVGGGTITNSGTIKGLVAAGNNSGAVGRGITLVGNDIGGGAREGIYADATVNNQAGGLIYGQSDSGIVVGGPATGHKVTINNDGTIQGGGAHTAAILTGADNDVINDTGHIDGTSSGLAIDMGAGTNKLTISGGSAEIDGDINGGTGSDSTLTIDPGAGNTFAFSDSLLNFNMVDIYSGMVTLSGVSSYTGTTKVTGSLTLAGANRLTGGGALQLNGGTLETSNAASGDSETFGCLSLTGNSTIDLDGSTLSFGCLSTVGVGDTLNVVDYDYIDDAYVFRFLGNLSGNANFQALLTSTTINGQAADARFDGTYTDVVMTPEPSTFALIALGGALAVLWRRRSARQAS